MVIENIIGNNWGGKENNRKGLEAVQNRTIVKYWSTLAPGLVVVGGELWQSATLEWWPMPTTANHHGHIPDHH